MTEVVALVAIVGAVAIVALVVGRPFRGRVGRQGVELDVGQNRSPDPRGRGRRGRKGKK
jgi:hypothetical protein